MAVVQKRDLPRWVWRAPVGGEEGTLRALSDPRWGEETESWGGSPYGGAGSARHRVLYDGEVEVARWEHPTAPRLRKWRLECLEALQSPPGAFIAGSEMMTCVVPWDAEGYRRSGVRVVDGAKRGDKLQLVADSVYEEVVLEVPEGCGLALSETDDVPVVLRPLEWAKAKVGHRAVRVFRDSDGAVYVAPAGAVRRVLEALADL